MAGHNLDEMTGPPAHTATDALHTRIAVLALALALLLPGCATAIRGTSAEVEVRSHPPGAEVQSNGRSIGEAPLTLSVPRRDPGRVTILTECGTYVAEIDSRLDWVIAGNIFFGPLWIAGVAGDLWSGGAYQVEPEVGARCVEGEMVQYFDVRPATTPAEVLEARLEAESQPHILLPVSVGIAGGLGGAFAGGIAGGMVTNDWTGLLPGAIAGYSIAMPLGVHLGNDRRGVQAYSLAASAGLGAAVLIASAVGVSGSGDWMLALPYAQLFAAVAVERMVRR